MKPLRSPQVPPSGVLPQDRASVVASRPLGHPRPHLVCGHCPLAHPSGLSRTLCHGTINPEVTMRTTEGTSAGLVGGSPDWSEGGSVREALGIYDPMPPASHRSCLPGPTVSLCHSQGAAAIRTAESTPGPCRSDSSRRIITRPGSAVRTTSPSSQACL